MGEWIENSYGVSYTRSALSKLLHRLDIDYRRPKVIGRKLDYQLGYGSPAVFPHARFVRIADTAGDMVRACATAMREPRTLRQSRADAFLRGMSWDQTWTRMAAEIDAVCGGRSPVLSRATTIARGA